jgi:hypothetical protein
LPKLGIKQANATGHYLNVQHAQLFELQITSDLVMNRTVRIKTPRSANLILIFE